MKIREFFAKHLSIAVLAAALPVAAPGDDDADALLGIYEGYVEAVAGAASFDELLPYLPESFAQRVAEVPPEQLEGFLAGVKQQLADGLPEAPEVVSADVGANEAELVLRAFEKDGPVRRTKQAGIDFARDADGWKLRSPQLPNWRDMEMLPADLGDPPDDGAPGPGAAPAEVPGALTDYALVLDEDGKRQGWSGEMAVLFDPRGHWMAVVNTRQQLARFIALDSLEERWAGKVWGTTPGVSTRHDGRALVAWGDSGGEIDVIPVLPHLDDRAPSDRNYFARPALANTVAAVGGDPLWREAAYHPTEPVLALGTPTAEGGALAFQPTGEGLWLPGEQPEATVWSAPDQPMGFAWSPTGDLIAYSPGFPDPGKPVVLREWPGGAVRHELSQAGFAFQVDPRFSRDGKHVLLGGYSEAGGGAWIVWNAESGEEVGRVDGTAMKVLAFSPDGKALLGIGETEQPVLEKGLHDTIYSVPVTGGEPRKLMEAFPPDERDLTQAVATLAFSPNGRYMVAVGVDGQLRVWDALGAH